MGFFTIFNIKLGHSRAKVNSKPDISFWGYKMFKLDPKPESETLFEKIVNFFIRIPKQDRPFWTNLVLNWQKLSPKERTIFLIGVIFGGILFISIIIVELYFLLLL
jgi:uncharacterized membrane protein